MNNRMKKKNMKTAGAILFWLLIWEIVALAVANAIVIATPQAVVKYLIVHVTDRVFYLSIGRSWVRIVAGFVLAFLSGTALAVICYRFHWIRGLFGPLMAAIKATPVAAITVILLLWVSSKRLSVVLCFLLVLPSVYEQLLAGLDHMNPGLLELAYCYRLPFYRRLLTIYRSETAAGLYGSLKACVGLSFKSAVAAEIIAIPLNTMGERLYFAKIHLDTPGVFAWTFVVVLLSAVTERFFLRIFQSAMKRTPDGLGRSGGRQERGQSPSERQNIDYSVLTQKKNGKENVRADVPERAYPEITLENVGKAYGGRSVLNGLDRTMRSGECHLIVGPSGAGKTTLLRILAHLTKPDQGTLTIAAGRGSEAKKTGSMQIGMVFQDEVVLPDYTALQNIEIFAGRRLSYEERMSLAQLLPADCLDKRASELSGGMKRRVQIARTMFS
ncbi:MAG: ATP-binding cassette domain-containing protein, partial [Lachnospiraceae bacterium]|nr:ATP-binding cassette domain-containing protein [Lachnospiraceae bacterium]